MFCLFANGIIIHFRGVGFVADLVAGIYSNGRIDLWNVLELTLAAMAEKSDFRDELLRHF